MTPDSSLLASLRGDDDFNLDAKDLVVKVDNPEKHSSTIDSYITFRIVTKVANIPIAISGFCYFSDLIIYPIFLRPVDQSMIITNIPYDDDTAISYGLDLVWKANTRHTWFQ